MVKGGYRNKIIFLGIIIIILIILIVFTYSKDCGHDQQCFKDTFESCKKAKVSIESDNGQFMYDTLGSKGDMCVTKITLTKLKEDAKQDLKDQLEGKAMVCEIPKTSIGDNSLFNTKDVSAYCTGPLREVFLQISLEKLYSFVVATFGPTAVDLTDDIGVSKNILF